MRPDRLRAIGRAYQTAFDAWGPDDVAFNRPYVGGHETATIGPRLRSSNRSPSSRDGVPRRLHLGAWQNEFLREFLLGPEAAAALAQPGDRLGDARPTTASTGSPNGCAPRTTVSADGVRPSPDSPIDKSSLLDEQTAADRDAAVGQHEVSSSERR